MNNTLRRYGPVALALVVGAASAQTTADNPIDFGQIATNGASVIAAAGAAGAGLLLARNGLKIAVKWAKSLVGMA
ncbi:hypothetical protein [Deinococcus sp. S9]|uniref:hypothetical protein n=1 Tax=Deinococcus sp. S9 TaxID=2545754 RepID=UPI0010546BC9|nr:hypothetical protein [Deinococcus sp. S9]TDE84655.1 hypothetical protein E0686_16015 [Deinococcus sp. S9]